MSIGLPLKRVDADSLESLEREPAYMRRNVDLDQVQHSSEPVASRYTLSNNEGSARPEILGAIEVAGRATAQSDDLWYLITLPLFLFFLLPGMLAWLVVSVWFLYRIVKGMVRMNDSKPVGS